ncbi:transcription factor [Schizosaccharomyces octosporus yFS286]|uniref:Transcription factor n=1 Tax=Schizosaccharomyces octosporus (strain yFS286) TaxID=483514 RepID=S9PXF5_SCHOY|nr:transcription factor [Schizosaccharomyces octosporus yFS286]EPX73766.1 transcription factor [Schizosaccharomyces octosporus yFS286]
MSTTPAEGSLERPYRSRKTRPCDNCRLRKSRCVLEVVGNPCALCLTLKVACTYHLPPIKRNKSKKRPDSISDESVFEAPSYEDTYLNNNSLAVHGIQRSSEIPESLGASSSARIPNRSQDKQGSQRAPVNFAGITEMYRTSDDKFDKLGLDISLNYPYVLGPTCDSDIDLIREYFSFENGVCSFDNMTLKYVSSNARSPVMYILDPAYENDRHSDFARYERALHDLLTTYVDEMTGRVLVDLYFTHIHPAYPILHGPRFLLSYKNGARNVPSILLAALYSLSLIYWKKDPRLSNIPPLDQRKMWNLVEDGLNFHFTQPRLSTIQAALLYLIGRPLSNMYSLTSILSRTTVLSQLLGFNHDCTNWEIPNEEKTIRKRIWWAIFIADKWYSMYFGLATNIHEDDYVVPKIDSNETLPLEITSSMSFKTFLKMIELSMILQDILQDLFTIRALSKHYKNNRSISYQITGFFSRLNSARPSKSEEPGLGAASLMIQFDAVEILLWKTALRFHLPEFQSEDLFACVEKAISNFMGISPDSIVDFFWPYAGFHLSTLVSLLIRLHLDFHESHTYGARALSLLDAFLRHCITLHATGFDIVEMAIGRSSSLLKELGKRYPHLSALWDNVFHLDGALGPDIFQLTQEQIFDPWNPEAWSSFRP